MDQFIFDEISEKARSSYKKYWHIRDKSQYLSQSSVHQLQKLFEIKEMSRILVLGIDTSEINKKLLSQVSETNPYNEMILSLLQQMDKNFHLKREQLILSEKPLKD